MPVGRLPPVNVAGVYGDLLLWYPVLLLGVLVYLVLFTRMLPFEDRERTLLLEAFILILVKRFKDGTCNAGILHTIFYMEYLTK